MRKNKSQFGKLLRELRAKMGLSLRQVCKLTNYDPSNWSKIERGLISPPSDEKVLASWAKILGLSKSNKAMRDFIDSAQIAQGIIPQDILTQGHVECLPAFFRTLRNKKPTKAEVDKLIKLIRNA